MRIGLYFGSFNPIHAGHLIIAQFMYNTGNFDKIRFVVSPRNPFKNEADLLDDTLRLEMVKASIANNPAFEVSDIEYTLPTPSYTIQTLNYFFDSEPDNTFSMILGSDNVAGLSKWKDIQDISEICDFHVYSRTGTEGAKGMIQGEFTYYNAPIIGLSSTYIRELIKNKKSIQYMVPDAVLNTLQFHQNTNNT